MLGKVDTQGAVAHYACREATSRPAECETDTELAPTGNVLYRRTVYEQLNGFVEDALTGADCDFSLRMITIGMLMASTNVYGQLKSAFVLRDWRLVLAAEMVSIAGIYVLMLAVNKLFGG